MCDFCHSSPHLPGCPNEPAPKAVCVCDYCGEDIVVGDEYVKVFDSVFHLACYEDDPVDIAEAIFGATKGVAEDD